MESVRSWWKRATLRVEVRDPRAWLNYSTAWTVLRRGWMYRNRGCDSLVCICANCAKLHHRRGSEHCSLLLFSVIILGHLQLEPVAA